MALNENADKMRELNRNIFYFELAFKSIDLDRNLV